MHQKIQPMTSAKTYEEAKSIFENYLEKKNYRKTPERAFIHEEIYSRDDHFDVEMLYQELKKNNYQISRATVYNTLDILLDCGLVIKHQFGNNVALYEKAYGYRQHDHLICSHCNKVLEFCDPRIQQIRNMMGELLKFKIERHSLTLYGNPMTDDKGKCLNCSEYLQ